MSNSFTSSFENINDESSSNNFLESIMSDAIKQRDKLKNKSEDSASDISDDSFELDRAIDEVIGETSNQGKVVRDKKDEVRKFSKFRHSIYGSIIKGPNKGKQIEIKYVMPGKLEIEIGINQLNEKISSSLPLKVSSILLGNRSMFYVKQFPDQTKANLYHEELLANKRILVDAGLTNMRSYPITEKNFRKLISNQKELEYLAQFKTTFNP